MAVIDALIDGILLTGSTPTSEEIAAQAGVSTATLFRYFDTLDELRADAVSHYFDRFAHLFEIPDIGEGTLDARVAAFTHARVAQYDTTQHIARLVRSHVLGGSEISAALHRLRATQTDQVRMHFSREFSSLTPAAADDLALSITTLSSFESWDQLTVDFSRTPRQIRRAWGNTIHTLLANAGPEIGRQARA